MDYLSYLISGWAISLGVIAVYAASLLHRGKALTASVPADRRRWISTND